ncbi:hypothetical protein PsorP6_006565 [Peronosclerospora sorghi]|uniref:Uncharacterized protein n=1 Tax=Peronosclerospora sorghi TaxID=230839 RepID=A0ACC0W782_9STRA|nr:hypothetical protein PsorP6_006565 [Peronosclerospora sorghi]
MLCVQKLAKTMICTLISLDDQRGDGVLGDEVGHGYLHPLPSMCRKTVGSSVGFAKLPKDAKAARSRFDVTTIDEIL